MSNCAMKSCFFVTPIGAQASIHRKRADDLLQHVLRPIAKEFLEITRADEVDEPGTITSDIVQRLYKSDLVIADLTGQNPNVMYEIGLRHCFNLPIVHLAQNGEKPPFDLASERIIFFDINDLSSVDEAKGKILRACKAAMDAKPFRSPVVRALELESLFASASEIPRPRDLLEKLDALEMNLDDVSSDLSILSISYDPVFKEDSNSLDSVTITRIQELVRLLDQVGPSDIAKLVSVLKSC
ncbi:hypothetical protein [Roseovarius sp. MS2]|uniref:hypothetical protein n=1 Tax=Roseovarius sp. MS2 TaxID=3390728 RepID=UPI003F5B3F9F